MGRGPRHRLPDRGEISTAPASVLPGRSTNVQTSFASDHVTVGRLNPFFVVGRMDLPSRCGSAVAISRR